MKILLFAFLFCCQIQSVFGQVRILHLPKKQLVSIDTASSFWYRWIIKQELQLDLDQVEKSPYSFHIRITNSGLILDVWQKDTLFQGRLTRWVKDADDKLRPFERTYIQKYELAEKQAAAIGQLVNHSGVLQLPSEENIAGWQQGLDGEEIVIQYSDDKNYYLKNYWSPLAQYDLKEAMLVHQFYNKVFELANANTVQKAFEAGIPFMCYTTDNASSTCRVVTTTQYWQYKREVSYYLRRRKRSEKGIILNR